MKNTIRIPGIIFLTTVYFLAINLVNPSYSYSGPQDNSSTRHGSWYLSASANLSSHTAKSEVSINDISNIPAPSFKDQCSDLRAIAKVSGKLIQTRFSSYTHHSRNFLVKHQKTDIIFPYHNFW
ncbi:MAG: hypothetical protein IH594_13525 [Bacteroidales bacterium]|nr:hypothetical protein [Bacteroidales bacterium]